MKRAEWKGEIEPRRRDWLHLNHNQREGENTWMGPGGMKSLINSFDKKLWLYSKMARICAHANAHFAKMT